MGITSEIMIVCLSVPALNFNSFKPIFFKLFIDIGIGQEWYGIDSGLISFRNKRVLALNYVTNVFGQYLQIV